ncbi:DUF1345 domain-containing protein [Sphingobium nicotianae]|uniref:DUF1345 domain-containing protein n=1 Tax=Sphingobium nicotianae TaxID=2782607 RepID=A0A9X1DFR2_9SPHN|nr:DUF1345 domain-containing protein [Sphingobium nicotianae]MBT2189155.1 DUF1345 domain-containing protein [Sphingobium nicotianae]
MKQNSSSSSILPWRYALFLLGFASAVPFALTLGTITGVMLGFDLGVIALLLTIPSLLAHCADRMREHARKNDANRTLILVLTGIVMMVILVIVASELRYGKGPSEAMLALIVATLILAWLFSNIVYTFHYAYLYYRSGDGPGRRGKDNGGLGFPAREEPDYWDFAYFAFTLGMTFQTSDIEISDPRIRKVALFHSLAAFLFNLGIVAFTINILGG